MDYKNLQIALKLFDRAVARFKAEHGRPAMLVLDNIDIVAQDSPKQLRVLQQNAKIAADMRLNKVVFVCSDGVAPS